jgi:hypothetical protein
MRGRQEVIDMVASYYMKEDNSLHDAPTVVLAMVEERMNEILPIVLMLSILSILALL